MTVVLFHFLNRASLILVEIAEGKKKRQRLANVGAFSILMMLWLD